MRKRRYIYIYIYVIVLHCSIHIGGMYTHRYNMIDIDILTSWSWALSSGEVLVFRASNAPSRSSSSSHRHCEDGQSLEVSFASDCVRPRLFRGTLIDPTLCRIITRTTHDNMGHIYIYICPYKVIGQSFELIVGEVEAREALQVTLAMYYISI